VALTRFFTDHGVSPQPIPELLTRSGRRFEERVGREVARKYRAANLAQEAGRGGNRLPDNDRVLAEARALRAGEVRIQVWGNGPTAEPHASSAGWRREDRRGPVPAEPGPQVQTDSVQRHRRSGERLPPYRTRVRTARRWVNGCSMTICCRPGNMAAAWPLGF
jgi:hypothetical protein